ncbi:MAG: GNAT family N-acetyltransferase [Phycisphaerales bacterium]
MTTDLQLLESMVIEPCVLENDFVTLEPITYAHIDDIVEAMDDSVFRYMPMRSSVRTNNEVRRYIDFQQSREHTIAFAVVDRATKKAVGSTSFMNIRTEHRGLEIGSTWIAQSARGTKINPSMKYLMLAHAFEALGAIRVELKTDARNTRSRAAILKLGAEYEGMQRNHTIMPDGHLRDTVMYSIVPDQWSAVKSGLLARINAGAQS